MITSQREDLDVGGWCHGGSQRTLKQRGRTLLQFGGPWCLEGSRRDAVGSCAAGKQLYQLGCLLD